MEFICNKEQLSEAISNVSKAVSVKSTIPALEGIKIKLADGVLELTGYDLEIGMRTSIPVKSDSSGECVIHTRLFSEISRRMPSDEISFQIDDNLNVHISGGNTEYDISAFSCDEYPDLPYMENQKQFSLPQSILKSMINQTIYAVSVIDTKPVLTGELFDIENGVFNLVAIDGYRLAVRTEKINCDDNFRFVVPSKALNEISRLLKDDDGLMCDVFTNNKHIMFDVNGYCFFSRLLEGDFHNYKSSLFTDFQTEVLIKTKDFIECLERCSLLINSTNKAPVKCTFNIDSMHIDCKTSIGRINDNIFADVSGDNITIGFNNKFLMDALKASESDKVRMLLNAPNKPVEVLPLQGDSYNFLLMPVNLK